MTASAPVIITASLLAGLVLGLSLKPAMDALTKLRSKKKKAAVILSGCGYLDGSECTEAIAILVSLSELGVTAQVFAPDQNQQDVMDHQTCKALGYVPRHMMQEAARLSRGNVLPLDSLHASDYDALLFPGGFGAAKSLSTWAKGDPQACQVLPAVSRVLSEFHVQGKPIGLCCIAPTLAAKVLRDVRLTVGKQGPAELWPYGGTVKQLGSLAGVTHVECEVDEVCVDRKNKLVTSPGFMFAAQPHQVFFGVRKMVRAVMGLTA